jgi:glycosyltransferase involved in cell wall biosynthesis
MPSDVAFVIPARNAAATLPMTLESVIAQTNGSWEAIIVDDGSTDDTPAQIAGWEAHDLRIRSVRQKPSGLGAARNLSASMARATNLVFLDADDLIGPDYLAVMLEVAERSTGAVLVHCAGAYLTPDGRIGPKVFPANSDYFRHLVEYNPFFVHSCMVNRDVFAAFKGFDESLTGGEDWDLWQRLARAGLPFASTDQSLTLYRMRPDSMVRDPALVLPSIKRVIRRGHTVDPRVANARPEFAEGWTDGYVDLRLLKITLWFAGIMIGANRDPAPLIASLSKVSKSAVDPTPLLNILSTIHHGILMGACALPLDWPDLTPRLRQPLGQLLKELEQMGNFDFSSDPVFPLFDATTRS